MSGRIPLGWELGKNLAPLAQDPNNICQGVALVIGSSDATLDDRKNWLKDMYLALLQYTPFILVTKADVYDRNYRIDYSTLSGRLKTLRSELSAFIGINHDQILFSCNYTNEDNRNFSLERSHFYNLDRILNHINETRRQGII